MARLNLRLRLPSFARLPPGNVRWLLYALYTLVLFVVFLVVNFPHHVLVRRVLSSVDLGPLRLEVRDTRFAWWKGYELNRVKLVYAEAGTGTPALLESRTLFVRPGLAGLLQGRISEVRVSGVLYNGDVVAKWASEDGSGRLTVSVDALELGRYPYVTALLEEGQLAGQLSGLVTVEPRGTDFSHSVAAGEIRLRNGRLAAAKVRGITVPDLDACAGNLKFVMRDGRAAIQGLELECNAVKLAVNGQVTVRRPPSASRLDLRLSARPGSSPTEEWKVLLPLAPCGVTGTLSRPRYQPCTGSRRAARR